MLMVRADDRATTLKEFLAQVRYQPGKLSAGYALQARRCRSRCSSPWASSMSSKRLTKASRRR
jgi:hypothetical protein